MALSVLDERITLKYGAGGRAMRTLIEEVFLDGMTARVADGDIGLAAMDDGAALRVGDRWLVITTDSHVIHPVFFPGGDIGRLAVSGTVNDLAMMGATEVLGADLRGDHRGGIQPRRSERIQQSIREACARGRRRHRHRRHQGDGQGRARRHRPQHHRRRADRSRRAGLRAARRRPLDRHRHDRRSRDGGDGAAATACRSTAICAPTSRRINGLVRAALDAAPGARRGDEGSDARRPRVGAARDGGEEPRRHHPRRDGAADHATPVRAASELLGIDPLHVANEGKAVLGVRPEAADAVLAALRAHPLGAMRGDRRDAAPTIASARSFSTPASAGGW